MPESIHPTTRIQHYFAPLTDPHQAINQDHLLLDIVVIAICAIIAGAYDWEAVADFGRAKATWFPQFLALPHGIPAHDTFGRVFRALDSKCFQNYFLAWIQVVSDGKKLRRSHDKGLGKQAIHLLQLAEKRS